MRRALALCAIAIASVGVTASQTAGSSGGLYDSVTGAGVRGSVVSPTTPAFHFALSAHDGPQGAIGTYNTTSEVDFVDFKGDVTCLSVSGNEAMVGGVVRKGGQPGQVGSGFLIGFRDNPSPTPDQVTLIVLFLSPPIDCADGDFLFDAIIFQALSGNVEVNDAP